MAIQFFTEGVKVAIQKPALKNWIKEVIQCEGCKVGNINIIFCTDDYLLDINQQYLKHDYFTDIITFDYSNEVVISGELFISLERIRDNAVRHGTEEQTELLRVIIHGIYHLCGYYDGTKAQRLAMTEKENEGLRIWEQVWGKIPGKHTM